MVKEQYITEQERASELLGGISHKALKRIRSGASDIDTIKALRFSTLLLAKNGISTSTIAKELKRKQPAIQYHLRCLEDDGQIQRQTPNSHWKTD